MNPPKEFVDFASKTLLIEPNDIRGHMFINEVPVTRDEWMTGFDTIIRDYQRVAKSAKFKQFTTNLNPVNWIPIPLELFQSNSDKARGNANDAKYNLEEARKGKVLFSKISDLELGRVNLMLIDGVPYRGIINLRLGFQAMQTFENPQIRLPGGPGGRGFCVERVKAIMEAKAE
jgi:hypothetical protein